MFIDADAVEAEFGREFQFIEISVVQRIAIFRVEIAVRQGQPDRIVLFTIAHIEIGVGHQMKHMNL